MDNSYWLLAAGGVGAVFGAGGAWALAVLRWNRLSRDYRNQLSKSEQARQFVMQQGDQARRQVEALQKEVEGGRNPKDAKVMLAKEITARFHSAAAAEAAEQDFIHRSRGGIPDDIPEVSLSGAPMGIAALLKAAGLAPSGSEAYRLIEGGGVRIDGAVVSDKGLKVEAGTCVVQVGKRKFARVTLA